MLFAVIADGHNDVLAAGVGACRCVRVAAGERARALAAGMLAGLAVAVKASFGVFGFGGRPGPPGAPRPCAAAAVGGGGGPGPELPAGRPRLRSRTTSGLATGAQPELFFGGVGRVLGWQHEIASTNVCGGRVAVLLAVMLLWRLSGRTARVPGGRADAGAGAGLAGRIAYAGFLVRRDDLSAACRVPASRLDWIAAACTAISSLAALPRLYRPADLSLPALVSLGTDINAAFVPVGLTVTTAGLLWLCFTGNWKMEIGDMRSDSGSLPVKLPFSRSWT